MPIYALTLASLLKASTWQAHPSPLRRCTSTTPACESVNPPGMRAQPLNNMLASTSSNQAFLHVSSQLGASADCFSIAALCNPHHRYWKSMQSPLILDVLHKLMCKAKLPIGGQRRNHDETMTKPRRNHSYFIDETTKPLFYRKKGIASICFYFIESAGFVVLSIKLERFRRGFVMVSSRFRSKACKGAWNSNHLAQ